MSVHVNIVAGSVKISEVPHHYYGSVYIVHCVDDTGIKWRVALDFIGEGGLPFAKRKVRITEEHGRIRISFDAELGLDWIACEE